MSQPLALILITMVKVTQPMQKYFCNRHDEFNVIGLFFSQFEPWFNRLSQISTWHDDVIKWCREFTGPGEFPSQRPVTRSVDVFFDLRLNKRLSKQPWGWWFETPSWSLWRQCNELEMHMLIHGVITVMIIQVSPSGISVKLLNWILFQLLYFCLKWNSKNTNLHVIET